MSEQSKISSIGNKRINRRRFSQGVAATAVALGAAAPALNAVHAQDKTKIKFWTHTHPPMVDLNKSLIEGVHGGQSGHRGPIRNHPEQ